MTDPKRPFRSYNIIYDYNFFRCLLFSTPINAGSLLDMKDNDNYGIEIVMNPKNL